MNLSLLDELYQAQSGVVRTCATMRYFFCYELPKIEGLFKRLMTTDRRRPARGNEERIFSGQRINVNLFEDGDITFNSTILITTIECYVPRIRQNPNKRGTFHILCILHVTWVLATNQVKSGKMHGRQRRADDVCDNVTTEREGGASIVLTETNPV